MMKDPIKALEDWVGGAKGRYVSEMSICNGYGATCWEVTIGNSDIPSGKGWVFRGDFARAKDWSEIYAAATPFIESDSYPPNVVFVRDDDDMDEFPGLGETILAAIKKAEELGL